MSALKKILLFTAGLLLLSVAPADAQSEPDIIFPIAPEDVGDFHWSDTWGACRGVNCSRAHLGVDLLGPKGAKVLAVESGRISYSSFDNSDGNWLELLGDSGFRYRYIHLNNDTPGTDDGNASCNQAFSQRLCDNLDGTRVDRNLRVSAGELIGYNGDSGNAEACNCPHVHFEIARPNGNGGFTSFNPTPAVDAAFNSSNIDVERVSRIDSTISQEAQIVRLYRAFFARIPDDKGFNFWMNEVDRGVSLEVIAESMAAGAEFETRFGQVSDKQYIEILYNRVLYRSSDDKGKAFWISELASGNANRFSTVLFFSEGEELKTILKKQTEAVAAFRIFRDRVPTKAELSIWIRARQTMSILEATESIF